MRKLYMYIWNNKLLLAIICTGLLIFTSTKIYGMLEIRGIIPGRIIESKIITDMTFQASSKIPGENVYWISWSYADISTKSNNRLNISEELWTSLEIGSEVEIIKLRSGNTPYMKNGIYASNGNFVFDIIMFLIEFTGIIYGIVAFIQRRKSIA